MTHCSPNNLLEALNLASELQVGHFYRSDGKARLIPHVGGEQEHDRLLFVLDGVKQEPMSIDNSICNITLRAGDVYFVGKNIWEYHGVADEHKLLCIVPRSQYLRVSFYKFRAGMKRGEWVVPEAIHTGRPIPPALRHIFMALNEESPDNLNSIRHLINAAAHCALSEVMHPGQSNGKSHATFERIRIFIDNNYMYPLNRSIIANKFFIHENYLSLLFRNNCGQSVHAYIESLRMDMAKDMLRNSDMAIKEIADCAGFSSNVYFVRRFREIEGIPPGQYRTRG